MLDTLKSNRIFKRLFWTIALAALVASVFVTVRQITDDFNGWITVWIVFVGSLATLRPIVTNMLWALRVTFILPIKWGKALGEWLDAPDDKAVEQLSG